MSTEEKQIASLKKQNEGMETSFQTRGIKFTKLSLDSMDPEAELLLLKDYNKYLKEIAAANKPVKVVEEKPSINEVKKEEEEKEESFEDKKPNFSTITNMEDIKRAFFSKEYDEAYKLIRQHPFKFYNACYKYCRDNDGRPSYVAKNLLRGFVQNLDNYRKNFLTCFRCISIPEKRYSYPSYWIVNSNDDLKTILGSLYDDFEFSTVVDEERISIMYRNMKKIDSERESDTELIGEVYLH